MGLLRGKLGWHALCTASSLWDFKEAVSRHRKPSLETGDKRAGVLKILFIPLASEREGGALTGMERRTKVNRELIVLIVGVMAFGFGSVGEAAADEGEGGPTYEVHGDRKSTRLNSSHTDISRMPSSA